MSKYFVIVNPNAGGGKAAKDWPLIQSLFTQKGLDIEVIFTKKRRHAMRLASDFISKGYRNFIVVGGDGTVNEVVNGMMAFPQFLHEMKLGVIMIGTGNDWGKMFDIPTEYFEAVDIIYNGKIFQQDVGRVTYHLRDWKIQRYFVNMAGLGFDAKVVENANKSKDKGKSSQFSYLITLFKTLMKYKPLDINIKIEGRPIHGSKLFTMSIGIGKYSGGGMMQVPQAIADDGLFDIMIVNNIGKAKIIRKIMKLYDGSIESLDEVAMHRAANLSIESKDCVMLEVDGESLGHGPFEFSIAEHKLNIIVG
jgi:diacylglycerol kinase (ATP)